MAFTKPGVTGRTGGSSAGVNLAVGGGAVALSPNRFATVSQVMPSVYFGSHVAQSFCVANSTASRECRPAYTRRAL
jgi:hypothetical protein